MSQQLFNIELFIVFRLIVIVLTITKYSNHILLNTVVGRVSFDSNHFLNQVDIIINCFSRVLVRDNLTFLV